MAGPWHALTLVNITGLSSLLLMWVYRSIYLLSFSCYMTGEKDCDYSIFSVLYNYLRRRRRLSFWCGLFVCPSDYSQTCERILTKFYVGVAGHGSRTKCYNFGGDPDHASDPGVQSPKSGSSGLPCSAEVCALWAYPRNFTATDLFNILLKLWLHVCVCVTFTDKKPS